MFESLDRVDWNLLHRQKLALLSLRVDRRLDAASIDAIEGLVNFVDALQDDAVAAGRWNFPGDRAERGGA